MLAVWAYWVLVLFQLAILAVFYYLSNGAVVDNWSARKLFQPTNWFLLFYALGFLVAQFILPFYEFPILGFELAETSTRIDAAVKAQFVLLLFLLAVLSGFLTVRFAYPGRTMDCLFRQSSAPASRYLTKVMFVIGIGSIVVLALGFKGGPRSMLVKTLEGKILYAATFFGSFGATVIAAHSIVKSNYLRALTVIGIFGAAVFFLGGRGRVLWPLVYIVIFYLIISRRRVSLVKLFLLLVVLFVLLQALDPLFNLVIRGTSPDLLWTSFFSTTTVVDLFLKRTFDGFHNLAVIVFHDAIPHDISVLLGGSGELFMSTYFPEVYSLGVGFPATLPGELWIAGGLWGVLYGGLAFGLVLGVLRVVYWRIRSESGLWLYMFSVNWLVAPAAPYFDQAPKALTAIMPAVIYLIADRFAGVRRPACSPIELRKLSRTRKSQSSPRGVMRSET